jgi:hypothetical protein
VGVGCGCEMQAREGFDGVEIGGGAPGGGELGDLTRFAVAASREV